MIPQYAEYEHKPENGMYGDCLRAALASLLSLPIAEVPHFAQEAKDNAGAVTSMVIRFLAERGLYALEFPYPVMSVQLKQQRETYGIDTYHLIFGTYPCGTGHVCVGLNGEIVWDPNPEGLGLSNPTDEWRILLIGLLDPGATM